MRLLPPALVSLALLTAGWLLASRNGSALPARLANAPLAPGNALSEITLAHLGVADHRSVSAWFGPQAAAAPVALALGAIAPLSARSAFLPDMTDLPPGVYSAVLQAEDVPLGAIARTEWPRSGGIVIANAPHRSLDEDAVIVPLVADGWMSAATYLTLQAADAEAAGERQAFEVELVDGRSAEVVSRARASVMGGWRSLTMPLGRGGPLSVPDGFRGWALVRSEGPAVAQAIVDFDANSGGILALEGTPLAGLGPDLYVPSVYVARRLSASDADRRVRHTLLVITNVGDELAEVAVHFVGRVGRCVSRTSDQTVTIAAGHQAWLGTWPPEAEPLTLPTDCGAAARLRVPRGGPVAGVAVDVIVDGAAATGQFGAYTLLGASDVARRIVAPLLRRSESGLTTAIAAMNAGSQPARANLRVYRADGELNEDCGSACQATIEPGAAALWSMARLPGIRSGFLGYGVIEGSQALAVTVAEEPEAGSGLDLALYNALPAQSTLGERQFPMGASSAGGGRPYVPLVFNVAPLAADYPPTVPSPSPGASATAATATPSATGSPEATATTPVPLTATPGSPTPQGAATLFLPLARR